MSKRNKPDKSGFVYSTDPNFRFDHEDERSFETLPPQRQALKVRLETKHRGGKTVTLVEGFAGKNEDLENLARELKNFCGTGGSAKDKEIIIQGDQREKVMQWLLRKGYINSERL
ncbi:MAG: translation initiation factor [Chitinophagaceae bacterium]|nr:translation initiation factor [Chitinophagaceae bacterium]